MSDQYTKTLSLSHITSFPSFDRDAAYLRLECFREVSKLLNGAIPADDVMAISEHLFEFVTGAYKPSVSKND